LKKNNVFGMQLCQYFKESFAAKNFETTVFAIRVQFAMCGFQINVNKITSDKKL